MISFSKFISLGNMRLAEAWSLFLGLEIAIFIRIQKLKIEIDSQEICNLIKNNTNELHHLTVLISNCMHLLSLFEEYNLLKISKNKNSSADLLAKNTKKNKITSANVKQAPPFSRN